MVECLRGIITFTCDGSSSDIRRHMRTIPLQKCSSDIKKPKEKLHNNAAQFHKALTYNCANRQFTTYPLTFDPSICYNELATVRVAIFGSNCVDCSTNQHSFFIPEIKGIPTFTVDFIKNPQMHRIFKQ